MARRATNVSRARIQDVALSLLATRGYALTSLQEIAAALDVTKAAATSSSSRGTRSRASCIA